MDEQEITLKDIFSKVKGWYRYLISKWLIVLVAGIIGGGIGVVYSYLKKPIYKATLSFALEDNKSGDGLGVAGGLMSQFGLDLGSGTSVFSKDNLLELMKSRAMVEKTLLSTINVRGKNETLVELYIDFNKYRDRWKDDSRLNKIDFPIASDSEHFSISQDSILGIFYKDIVKNNLNVNQPDVKSSIITIEVNSKSELFSKYFAELLVTTVSDFYKDIKTQKSAQNVNILQRQADSVRRKLNEAIGNVASSVDLNPNANPLLQVLKTPSQKHQVDVQANTTILSQLVANLELAKITLRKETPLIQVIDKPIFPLDNDKPGTAKCLIIGAILASFIVSCVFILKSIIKDLLNEHTTK